MNLNYSVGIITVVYNGVNYIENTILSVIKQSYKNFEFIIIDGGSNDGTLEIIEKYKHKITFYKSESDKGVYDAMNKGVTYSKSEWINFMNAGDSFYDENVLKNIFVSNEPLGDVIYGPVNCFDKYKNVIVKPKKISKLENGMAFCHQAAFVKRELLLKYKFDNNYKICADYNLFYQLFKEGSFFFETPFCIANYELETGISSKNVFQSAKENLKIQGKWGSLIPMINLFFQSSFLYFLLILKKVLPFWFLKKMNSVKYKVKIHQ